MKTRALKGSGILGVVFVVAAFLSISTAFAYIREDAKDKAGAQVKAAAKTQEPKYVEGEVLVTFSDDVVNAEAEIPALNVKSAKCLLESAVVAKEKSAFRKNKSLEPGWYNYKIGDTASRVEPTDKEFLQRAKSKMSKEERKLLQTYLVTLKPGEKAKAALKRLSKNRKLRVELNYMVEAQWRPNDTYYSDQWAHQNMQSEAAWDITRGSANVVIAIVDTGVDYTHEDLAANMWHNPGEIPNNGIDDDGNGFVDDIYGYDFYNRDSDPMDDHSHGTHCAGIAAAVANNSKGVAGVCPNARIMAVKFMGLAGGTTSSAIAGIYYAVDNGAKIISNSWGLWTGQVSGGIQDVVNYANSVGCFIVAAAGNDNLNVDGFQPANCRNMFAVGAMDRYNGKASFSNYGPKVDVVAPGVAIVSTVPGNGYAFKSGTSMACPHVAGEAALILSRNPGFTPLQIANAIRVGTTPDISSYEYVGMGRINLVNALNITNPPLAAAYLASPVYNAQGNYPVAVSGSATGTHYSLKFTKSNLPYSANYTQFAEGGQVPGGLLANFYPEYNGQHYFLKLLVTDSSGYQLSNVTQVIANRPAPVITGITPSSAAPGTSAVITGTAFGNNQEEISVLSFPGAVCSVTSWQDNSITFIVPNLLGTASVAVGVGSQWSNHVDFTVTNAPQLPVIAGLAPTSGLPNSSLTINGSNFGTDPAQGEVKFADVSAILNAWSATSITCTVPELDAGTYPVTVSLPIGTSNALNFNVLASPTLPFITSLSPDHGSIGSETVINGRNFGSAQGDNAVKFDLHNATVLSWSDTAIRVTVPNVNYTQVPVYVVKGGNNSNAVNFTVTAAPVPVISTISPASGLAGSQVTISGTGLKANVGTSSVSFADIGAGILSASNTSITCTVPQLSPGSYPVTVSTAGGTSNAVNFTVVVPAPVITRLSDSDVDCGQEVSIFGSNFGAQRGQGYVEIEGITLGQQQATYWSDAEIRFIVSAIGTSQVNTTIRMFNDYGNASNRVSVRISNPQRPLMTSIQVNSYGGSRAIDIYGSFTLNAPLRIYFQSSSNLGGWVDLGYLYSGTVTESSHIRVPVPQLVTAPGLYRLEVENQVNIPSLGLKWLNSDFMQYTMPAFVPAISSIAPINGLTGSAVTISGSNFGAAQGSGVVSFADINAAVTSWGDTSIKCIVPTVSAKTYPVTVRTADGVSNAVNFTVIISTLPSISAIKPSFGYTKQEIAIEGQNFGALNGKCRVVFSRIPNTSVGTNAHIVSWGDTLIKCLVPNWSLISAQLPCKVRVVNRHGTSKNVDFTVIRPFITTLSVSSGKPGTTVTIIGVNFGAKQGSSIVRLGNAVATISPNGWSDTAITCVVPAVPKGKHLFAAIVAGDTSNLKEFTVK